MSNMAVDVHTYAGDVQILKRPPFEGIPVTLDFTDVSGGVVKAGTPVSAAGVAVNGASGDDAPIGILLFDVYAARPQGTALTKAYINEDVAKTHSGVTVDAAVKAALPMVVFE